MMERGDYVFGTIFLSLVLGLSYVSTKRIGAAEADAAVASAVRYSLVEMVGEEVINGAGGLGPAPLCLTSATTLDFDVITRELDDTIIRPFPVSRCSSRTVEGDFGMFTSLTYHYTPDGEEAAHLEIANIDCPNSTNCVIDVDSHGWGERYWLKRLGHVWTVERSRTRWIV